MNKKLTKPQIAKRKQLNYINSRIKQQNLNYEALTRTYGIASEKSFRTQQTKTYKQVYNEGIIKKFYNRSTRTYETRRDAEGKLIRIYGTQAVNAYIKQLKPQSLNNYQVLETIKRIKKGINTQSDNSKSVNEMLKALEGLTDEELIFIQKRKGLGEIKQYASSADHEDDEQVEGFKIATKAIEAGKVDFKQQQKLYKQVFLANKKVIREELKIKRINDRQQKQAEKNKANFLKQGNKFYN